MKSDKEILKHLGKKDAYTSAELHAKDSPVSFQDVLTYGTTNPTHVAWAYESRENKVISGVALTDAGKAAMKG